MAMDGMLGFEERRTTRKGIDFTLTLEGVLRNSAPRGQKKYSHDEIKTHMESIYQEWVSQYGLLDERKIVSKKRKVALKSRLTEEMRAYTGRITQEREFLVEALQEQYVERVKEATSGARKLARQIKKDNIAYRDAANFYQQVEETIYANRDKRDNEIKNELYHLLNTKEKQTSREMFTNYKAKVRYTLDNLDQMKAHVATMYAPAQESTEQVDNEKIQEILAKGPRTIVRMRGQGDQESDRTLEEEEDDEVITYTKGKPLIIPPVAIARDVVYDTAEAVMSLEEVSDLLAEIGTRARTTTPTPKRTVTATTKNNFEESDIAFFNDRRYGAQHYAEQSLDERVSKQESYKPASWYHTAARYAAAVVGTVASAGTIIGSLTVMLSGFSANLTDYAESQLHVGKYAPQAVVSTEVYHAPEQGQAIMAEKHYVLEAAHEKAKPAHAAHRKARVETAADGSVIKNPGYKIGAYSTANAQVEIPTTEHVQYTPTISTPEIRVRRPGEVWQQEIARYQINLQEAKKGKE